MLPALSYGSVNHRAATSAPALAACSSRTCTPASNYLAREEHPRHVEHLVLEDSVAGDGQEQPETVAVKLGIWRSNMRSRRDKLPTEQQAALDEIGL